MTSKKPAVSPLSEGDQVELCGLVKAPHLNRRIGTVVGGILDSGRYPVILMKETNQRAVKPENLKAIEEHIYTACSGCMKVFSGLTVCGNCHMVFYCGKECQQLHWNQKHKQQCALFKQGRKAKQDETKLPTDPRERMTVRMRRGCYWLEKGKFAKAEAEFKGVMQEPWFEGNTNVTFYVFLAQSMIFQQTTQKNDEALTVVRKAVALPYVAEEQDSVAEAYNTMGHLLKLRGKDLVGAEKAYQKVLELRDSNSPSAADTRRALREVQEKLAAQASDSKKSASKKTTSKKSASKKSASKKK